MNLIYALIGIALFILWSQKLLELAQSKKNKRKQFYLLLFIPYLLSFTWILLVLLEISLVNAPLAYIIALLLIINSIGFGKTLYKVAGDDRKIWFYSILLFSPLWIVYIALEEI